MATPSSSGPVFGLVDAGRLGASLAEALRRAGHTVVAVSRRDPEQARALARRLGDGVLGTSDPQAVVKAADAVFLTSPDDRIGWLARELAFRSDQIVIHCSGATPVSVLAPARAAGAETGGFHPLQTFPDEHGADRFAGVTFGIEAERPSLLQRLQRLAVELGGTSVTLDEESRPLYHASAVMAGPLTAALAGLASELWTRFGHDREAGLRALSPLLKATTDHLAMLGIPAAMTGPYVRGDLAPVRAHLAALGDADPEVLRAYASLALAQLPLAAERGNIPEDRMRELHSLLADAART
ncbi:MAG: DUF2520 domain-containing protein [Gemmatimonadota bacterium]|nr:DUF2520 domain-containing protein [Gemmatimonadota bacterium]